jgi:hypothetical protein
VTPEESAMQIEITLGHGQAVKARGARATQPHQRTRRRRTPTTWPGPVELSPETCKRSAGARATSAKVKVMAGYANGRKEYKTRPRCLYKIQNSTMIYIFAILLSLSIFATCKFGHRVNFLEQLSQILDLTCSVADVQKLIH